VIPSTSSELYAAETSDPYLVAVRAYVWAYAPVLAARLRQAATNPVDPFAERLPTFAGAPLNNLGHQRQSERMMRARTGCPRRAARFT